MHGRGSRGRGSWGRVATQPSQVIFLFLFPAYNNVLRSPYLGYLPLYGLYVPLIIVPHVVY